MDYCRGIKWNTSVVQYFLITLCANFSFKKDTAQHHQLALGLSAEWSLLGDGWIPPLFWFSEPSLHDGALSLRPVPGGSWERESPARPQQPSLWSSGRHRCHSPSSTPTLLTYRLVGSTGVDPFSRFLFLCVKLILCAEHFFKTRWSAVLRSIPESSRK